MEKTIIAIRHYPDRKKASLVLEHGNQGIILATFRNEKMVKLLKEVIGRNVALSIDDERTIDELLKHIGETENE